MTREETIKLLQEKAHRLRVHCLRATSEAGSGHPTTCLSAAELVAALFFHVMRYDPQRPDYAGNDRFVLSKGHAAPLLYAAWAEAGALPVAQLLELRKHGSLLEGHPTPRFPGALVATGALGQGLSIAAGMALAAKHLDHAGYRVYALLGDGECAEGAVWEAAAFAAHYKLDNLVAVVDVNRLGQSQPTMYQHDTTIYARRFAASGWQAFEVRGHDLGQILDAFDRLAQVKGQPAAIIARTVKGKGVSFLEDKEGWHGKPLSRDELAKALAEIPASGHTARIGNPGGAVEIQAPPPAPARPVPSGQVEEPNCQPGQKVATREAYGAALTKLGRVNPRVVALDGDVKNSTFAEVFARAHPDRFFECFIAEQNMIGVAVGLATTGRIPFASSFAAFHTRAYDFIRMAAISRANLKLLGTHCGVSIGEDGPSQMGLEDLAMMRAIPGSVVLYPADAVAMERLVAEAAEYRGIVYLRATRPKTPVIYANSERFPIGGAKVVRRSERDRATVVAAGITLYEALAAHDALAKEGIAVRVIDAYSVKPIDRATLLEAARATGNALIVVEDHYYDGGLGDGVLSALAEDAVRVIKLAVVNIPTSGKPDELLDAAGLSARHIAAAVRRLMHS